MTHRQVIETKKLLKECQEAREKADQTLQEVQQDYIAYEDAKEIVNSYEVL